jgi:hypothetical protein
MIHQLSAQCCCIGCRCCVKVGLHLAQSVFASSLQWIEHASTDCLQQMVKCLLCCDSFSPQEVSEELAVVQEERSSYK